MPKLPIPAFYPSTFNWPVICLSVSFSHIDSAVCILAVSRPCRGCLSQLCLPTLPSVLFDRHVVASVFFIDQQDYNERVSIVGRRVQELLRLLVDTPRGSTTIGDML